MHNPRTKIYLILSLITLFSLTMSLPLKARAQEHNQEQAREKTQEQQPKVSLQMKEEKEVIQIKEGKETLERVPAEEVKSLDTLVYSVSYTNQGAEEARNISIIDPIPENTTYIAESAEGQNTKISFSLDGGKVFQSPPVKYLVVKADGTWEEQIAPPKMYTHIKWIITDTVLPGKGGQVSFKVKVK